MNDAQALRFSVAGNPPVLAIAGDIDEDTYPLLVRTLAELGGSEIHLSLAGVEFCDLAGLRAIVALAGTGRDGPRPGPDGPRPGRRVVLHDVPPQLQTVLRIVGWDATAGLVIRR